MVLTRSKMAESSVESSGDIIIDDSAIIFLNKTFNELRESLINDFKAEIKTLVDAHRKEIEKLDSTVAMLQEHVSYLKQDNEILSRKIDENEQYGRRLCLRIEGVAVKSGKETAEDVYKIVEKIISEAEVDIPPDVLDRVHRIGKPQEPKEQGKPITQSIIVRFSTFRHRTLLYHARKSVKSAKVRLDLTKARYGVLNLARDMVKNDDKVKFVYSDINCRLKVHLADGNDNFFNNLDELKDILSY